MIDSHCHLDLAAFDNDWLQQIEAAKAKGVTRFLVPGTTEAGWDKQLAMTQTVAEIDIAFGLHPYFLPDDAEPVLARLDARLKQSTASLVALGEIGIDASLTTPIQRQQQVFEKQLVMATQYQLPVILHHRKSHHLLIESLKRCRFQYGGVIHAFSGSLEAAKAYTDLGFCIGVGGTITYPRAQKTRQTIAQLPIESLLLETDAPDMPMCGRQGERNAPVYLPDVCQALAELKHTSVEDIDEVTSKNYLSVFGR